jgi:hypothetical protein
MPQPTITSFSAKANLGPGVEGLNSKLNSNSPVVISGANLQTTGMTVTVTNGSLNWSGDLKLEASIWRANLKCSSASEGTGETENVTVTVVGSDGTSPNFTATTKVVSVPS